MSFYVPRNAADAARIRQQNGDFPAPHEFQPDVFSNPDMCQICFATRVSDKPWHRGTTEPRISWLSGLETLVYGAEVRGE